MVLFSIGPPRVLMIWHANMLVCMRLSINR